MPDLIQVYPMSDAVSAVITKLKELYGKDYDTVVVYLDDNCLTEYYYFYLRLSPKCTLISEDLQVKRDSLFNTQWYTDFKVRHPKVDFNVIEVFHVLRKN